MAQKDRLGDRLHTHRLTHTHTGWPLPLAWFTLALGTESQGGDVGPELQAGL